MTSNEMKEYGLDENEFHLCISETRKILSKILHNSPIKTGFESTSQNEKILLQLYPEKHGGCELYVTKLNIEEDYSDKKDGVASVDETRLLPVSTRQNEQEKKPLICYCFEELNEVIIMCRTLHRQKVKCESSLYMGDNGKYYMFFSHKDLRQRSKSALSNLSEFGELTNAEHSTLLLSERGRSICDRDAIETLSKL